MWFTGDRTMAIFIIIFITFIISFFIGYAAAICSLTKCSKYRWESLKDEIDEYRKIHELKEEEV